jgi:hypothetical protein
MCLHCNLADAELPTDLFIQQTRNHQSHDLLFTRSECRVAVPKFAHFRFMSASEAAFFKGLPNGGQQYFVIERLGEEFDSAALHRLHGFWHVAITGNENDRHVGPFDSNTFLQFETI